MDRRSGLPLALVKSTPEREVRNTPPKNAVAGTSTACSYCGGSVVERRTGSTYCCDAAELTQLRALVQDLDRQLMVELEDPPTDEHLSRFLSYMRANVRRARQAEKD